MAAKLEPAKDYKRLALSPRQWKNQALAAIHRQTLPAKNTLKYYQEFDFKQTSKLPPYLARANFRYRFTLSQSKKHTAHDHLVQQFAELFLWYEETRNTSGQYWVLHSAEYLGITYDVCRYISTGRLPFEELIDTFHFHDQEENGDCF